MSSPDYPSQQIQMKACLKNHSRFKHQPGIFNIFWQLATSKRPARGGWGGVRATPEDGGVCLVGSLYLYIPPDPCLVFLPTFTINFNEDEHVGKYTVHILIYIYIYLYLYVYHDGKNQWLNDRGVTEFIHISSMLPKDAECCMIVAWKWRLLWCSTYARRQRAQMGTVDIFTCPFEKPQ